MDTAEDNNGNSMIGRRIGVYELRREIGRGGMGAVYLAERVDGEFYQTVAVKLIKRGMDTDLILKRFRRERQILAALNHPNIAYFLGGGSTPDGLPYFVMEYIEGKPLYRFCDENKLSVKERLRIFRQICDAAEAAHQIKVIHRDLKPSNILVKNSGKPKLLDFGIAKVLDPELEATEIEPTATHLRALTPEYASPEQVRGDEITPASDVYSLGVVLYELLTGHRPYRLRKRASYEVARVICEEKSLPPSESVSREENLVPTADGENAALESVFVARSASPEDLRDELSGDLDKIILKTLRKNPAERYASAAELAEDITNYLEEMPVNAESFPASGKFTGAVSPEKHSVAILPFKLLGAARTDETGDDEFLSVGLADALVTRLSNMQRIFVRPTSSVLRFGDLDSFDAGRELGVKFVVDGNLRRVGSRIRVTARLLNVPEDSTHWSESFDESLTDVLELEDSMSEKIAQALIPQLTGEEQRKLAKRGTNDADAYEAYLRGRFYWNLQSEEGFTKAIMFYERAVRLDPDYALAYSAIAEYYIYLGIHCVLPFAETTRRAKIAALKAVELDETSGEAQNALGTIAINQDFDWIEGEKYMRRAIEINPNIVSARRWYNALLLQSGRLDEALEQARKIGELDPDSVLSLHFAAWSHYHRREFDRSIEIHRKMLADEPFYAWGHLTLSWTLRCAGRFDEALATARKSVELSPKNAMYHAGLSAAQVAAGDIRGARQTLAEIEKMAAVGYVSPFMQAIVYCQLGEFDRAFELLEKGFSERDVWVVWIGIDPQFDRLKNDERYNSLLRRMNHPLAPPEKNNAKNTAKNVAKIITKKPTTGGGQKSIAVLPLKLFGTPTGTGDEEFLGIGLADALVTRLSNLRRLVVRPTSSVLPFGEATTNPFEAGRELDVDYVLDGNIRRSGERIRVSVQLLNVGENRARWAENFNEKFTDVLELEDSISERVVKSLLPQLTGDEEKQMQKRGTNSPEAYESYLRGRFHWNQFTPDALLKARDAFQQSIRFDPTYALPHAGLADFYIWASIYGLIPAPEAASLAEAAALRAVELDENSGEAFASLSLIHQNRFDWAKSEELYQKSLELAPNYVHSHEWWAAQLVGHGKFDAGVREIRIAERLDPLSLRTKTLVAWTLYQAHRFDDALQAARQIVDLDGNYPQGYSQIGNNLLQIGRIEEAVDNFRKFNQMIPNSALAKYTLCHGLAASGRMEEARRILEEMKTLAASGYVKPYFLGMAHAGVGERDAAFANFEKAFAENDPWMLWFGTEPMLDRLRDDARFDDLLRRMNLPVPENRRYVTETPGEINDRKLKREKTSEREVTDEKGNYGKVDERKTSGRKADEKNGDTKSIAVLPLKFIGAAETDDRYLSVGLADAMITRLSNVRRLNVRPTSSITPFADYEDAFAAGGALGVDFVLCGTIRRAGERIRISAQLIEVETGTTLWADKFNENFTDVLELEDLVAEKTARLLVPKLTGEERKKLAKRGTDSPQAFEAYLRGRYHLNLFTPEEFDKAKSYFEQAIALDAEYALAYVGLADYYFGVGTFGTAPPLECYARARRMAERALEIDDALGEAYAILGFAYFADLDFEKVERTLRRSVELSPNYSLGRVWLSVLLTFYGKHDEAVAEAKRAAELNPLSPFDRQHYAWILYHARRFDEAETRARRALEGEPRFSHGLGVLAWILRQAGQAEESIETARRAVEFSGRNPWLVSNLAASYAKAGRRKEAIDLLRELGKSSGGKFVSPYCLAVAYWNLGDADRAFACLEEAFETRDVWLIWMSSDAQLDGLRDDGRYQNLLRRVKNLRPEQERTEIIQTPTGGEKSIVVLPFRILGAANTGETGDEYLSVGLADALITRLSNIRRFVVRPTSAVLRYRDASDPVAAGRELDAAFVLESSLRRVGERFRVTVRLLSVGENATRWAQTFDEGFTDFLALEDSISEKVAASLVSQLSGEERENLARRPTDNPQAYEAYLHGRFYWHKFTPEGFQKAIEFYRRAVALAPDYALAYAGIADYYNFLGVYTVMPFAEASEKAKEAALRAIVLDDRLAEGYAALGFAVIMHDFDWESAGEYLSRAVELNPNYATARVWYCYYLSFCGRFDEAFDQINRALEIDRLTPLVPQTLCWTMYHAGHFDEAIDATRKLIESEPQYGLSYLFLSSMLWRVGRYEEALKTCRRAVQILGRTQYTLPWLASAHAAAGNREKATALLSEIEEMAKTRYVSPYLIGMVYVNLGDAENAFARLEKAVEIRDGRVVWLGVDPQFEALRGNPRFNEILKRTGNPLVNR